ncbi:hypothetical protein [Algoriphagus resistens]|uniref:hypothetical protein n=1 Tax=Algoriphagus resistens TaxID=1750590 RepID=UPI0007168DC4|nr:hypothetical protein [Algoriphagus resistens]
MEKIEIHGNDDMVLSVSLFDILNCIENGQNLYWKILWLEAIGDLGDKTMLKFEREVNNSINGYEISWKKLINLSLKFSQVIEILIIADKDELKVKRYLNDDVMHKECTFTIELIDSSYWVVHSNNISLNPMLNILNKK